MIPDLELAALCRAVAGVCAADPRVSLAYVFGSVAEGRAGPRSDVDVAVLLREPFSYRDVGEIGIRLDSALSRRGRPVDIAVLNDASPVLRREVVAGGRLAHKVSDEIENDFEMRALRDCLDTKALRRLQWRYLQEDARTWSSSPTS